MDNLEETGKFLKAYSLTKLSQEETDNLNRLITRSKIKTITTTKKTLKTRVQEQMDRLGNSTKHIKKNLYLLLKLFQKIEEEGKISNSFYEAITLIPKLDKDTTKKENYRPVP